MSALDQNRYQPEDVASQLVQDCKNEEHDNGEPYPQAVPPYLDISARVCTCF